MSPLAHSSTRFTLEALTCPSPVPVGLHLGIHRLTIGHGGIGEDLLTARRDTFWSAFASDVIAALYIGRNIAIDPLEVDTIPSPIASADEYEAPSEWPLFRVGTRASARG